MPAQVCPQSCVPETRSYGYSYHARSRLRAAAGDARPLENAGTGCGAAGHGRLRAVLVTARWTAAESVPHQCRDQPPDAAAHTAGGAQKARKRTKSRTKSCAPALPRLPTQNHKRILLGVSRVFAGGPVYFGHARLGVSRGTRGSQRSKKRPHWRWHRQP